jgi:hypothetical protein
MKLDALLLLGLLSAAIHWIVARSKIMQWFWASPRLPVFVRELLECPACSGFWIGLGLGLAGVLPAGSGLLGVLYSGLLGVLVTPVVEGVLLWGLSATKIR